MAIVGNCASTLATTGAIQVEKVSNASIVFYMTGMCCIIGVVLQSFGLKDVYKIE